jgi:thioredoxin-related protein
LILKEDEMKKWLIMLATVTLGLGAFASEGWETDFEKASAQAKAEGKHMLVDFSGSDWCGWCIKLDNEVFSKEAFKAYAKGNLILVLADFPRDDSKQSSELKKQNKALSEKFSVRGFPTVIILDSEGKAVAQTGYQAGGPEAYVEHVKKLIAEAK